MSVPGHFSLCLRISQVAGTPLKIYFAGHQIYRQADIFVGDSEKPMQVPDHQSSLHRQVQIRSQSASRTKAMAFRERGPESATYPPSESKEPLGAKRSYRPDPAAAEQLVEALYKMLLQVPANGCLLTGC
jgi:hypothetical protein